MSDSSSQTRSAKQEAREAVSHAKAALSKASQAASDSMHKKADNISQSAEKLRDQASVNLQKAKHVSEAPLDSAKIRSASKQQYEVDDLAPGEVREPMVTGTGRSDQQYLESQGSGNVSTSAKPSESKLETIKEEIREKAAKVKSQMAEAADDIKMRSVPIKTKMEESASSTVAKLQKDVEIGKAKLQSVAAGAGVAAKEVKDQTKQKLKSINQSAHAEAAHVEAQVKQAVTMTKSKAKRLRKKAAQAAHMAKEKVTAAGTSIHEALSSSDQKDQIKEARSHADIAATAADDVTDSKRHDASQGIRGRVQHAFDSAKSSAAHVKDVVSEKLETVKQGASSSLEAAKHGISEKLHAKSPDVNLDSAADDTLDEAKAGEKQSESVGSRAQHALESIKDSAVHMKEVVSEKLEATKHGVSSSIESAKHKISDALITARTMVSDTTEMIKESVMGHHGEADVPANKDLNEPKLTPVPFPGPLVVSPSSEDFKGTGFSDCPVAPPSQSAKKVNEKHPHASGPAKLQ